jgi:hypothetical protein
VYSMRATHKNPGFCTKISFGMCFTWICRVLQRKNKRRRSIYAYNTIKINYWYLLQTFLRALIHSVRQKHTTANGLNAHNLARFVNWYDFFYLQTYFSSITITQHKPRETWWHNTSCVPNVLKHWFQQLIIWTRFGIGLNINVHQKFM